MEYVGDALDPEVHETFEAHITGCHNCHTYLDQYRDTIRAGQLACTDDQVPGLPEDLVQAVLLAIAKEPQS
jgi:hypothetical protein